MRSRNRLSRRLAALGTSLFVLVALAGCSMTEIKQGWLPTKPGMTNQTDRMMNLWVGSWIAAWIVGFITWGLMFWCIIAYRRRKNDTSLPVQLRYHMPLEIMYTIIPIFMVGVLFFYTVRDVNEINHVDQNDKGTVVQVIGKRWAWDFNYISDGVYDTSEQVPLDGTDDVQDQVPTLYLQAGKRVTFQILSRDVDHSFWIPAFLYKRDMIPGKTDQYFQITPNIEGTYPGKCAELCGEYHSEMIFQVKVVSAQEYQAKMAQLKEEGQTGCLPLTLGRADDAEANSDGRGLPAATTDCTTEDQE